MELTANDVTYILVNLFRTYAIFKLLNIFYDREGVNVKFEIALYSVYCIVLTLVCLIGNIPYIMLLCNTLGLFVLTFNYKGGLKSKFLSVIYVYIISICVESIVVLMSGYVNTHMLSENNYTSIFGLVSIPIILYAVALLMQNFKNVKKGKSVPVFYWISAVAIPLASLFIIINILNAQGLGIVTRLLCIAFLFCINLITFTLYDVMVKALEERMDRRLLTEQNNYYERQFELMKTSLESTRAVRHDMVNHLSSLRFFVKSKEYEKTEEYLEKLLNQCEKQRETVHSGNVIIDSIMNYKLQEMENKNIEADCEIQVPESLEIESFDMTVILGNLLDNAIHACSKIEPGARKIKIDIRFNKGILVIKVKNSYNGIVDYENEEIVTTSGDRQNHGIGLQNIKKAVERNHGVLDIVHTVEYFLVTAMLYVNAETE